MSVSNIVRCYKIYIDENTWWGQFKEEDGLFGITEQNIPGELWVEITIQLNQSRLSNNNRAQTV